MEYIDACTLVHLRIKCWTGKTRLDDQDFVIGKDGKMPSKKVARLGEKYIIDPTRINAIESYRTAAHRCCKDFGARILGAYAVANEALDSVIQRLDTLSDKFENDLVPNFLADYQQETEAWVKSNFTTPVSIPDINSIRSKFGFKYTIYSVNGESLPDSEEFADSLLEGVAADVRQLWKSSISGKNKISQRFLNQSLDDLYKKLKMLSFGDSRILQIVADIEHLKALLPKSGGILRDTPQYLKLTNILLALMSPERVFDILGNNSGNTVWSISDDHRQDVTLNPSCEVLASSTESKAADQEEEVSPEPEATVPSQATGTLGWF